MPTTPSPLVVYRDGGLWLPTNRDRLTPARLLQWRPAAVPIDAGVERVDLLESLPLEDHSVSWICAFHVLEHLDLHEGRRFLAECRRVLAPGGRLRISTPDFAGHLRAYLECLEKLRRDPGNPRARTDLEFTRLLVLDQRLRRRSGGRMLEFLRTHDVDRDLSKRILGLTGPFLLDIARRQATASSPGPAPRRAALPRALAAMRRRLLRRRSAPWWSLDCRETRELEITTWDAVSLERELKRAGFDEVSAVGVETSQIPDWPDLDRCPRTGEAIEHSAIAEGRSP